MTRETLYDIIIIVINFQLSNAAGPRAPGGVLLLNRTQQAQGFGFAPVSIIEEVIPRALIQRIHVAAD